MGKEGDKNTTEHHPHTDRNVIVKEILISAAGLIVGATSALMISPVFRYSKEIQPLQYNISTFIVPLCFCVLSTLLSMGRNGCQILSNLSRKL